MLLRAPHGELAQFQMGGHTAAVWGAVRVVNANGEVAGLSTRNRSWWAGVLVSSSWVYLPPDMHGIHIANVPRSPES